MAGKKRGKSARIDLLRILADYCERTDATSAQSDALFAAGQHDPDFIRRLPHDRKLTLEEIRAAPGLDDNQRYCLAFGRGAPIDWFALGREAVMKYSRMAVERGSPITAEESAEIHREAYSDPDRVY